MHDVHMYVCMNSHNTHTHGHSMLYSSPCVSIYTLKTHTHTSTQGHSMLCFGAFPDSPQRINQGTFKPNQGTDAKFDQVNRLSNYQGADTEERGTYHHQSVTKAQRSLNLQYSNISISDSDLDKRTSRFRNMTISDSDLDRRTFGVPPELRNSVSERVPITNHDDFDQYQKRVRFTTGQDLLSEQTRTESESQNDFQEHDIPAHEYIRVDMMHAERDSIRPYVRSEIENAGMKALLAEESGMLGGRPEEITAQDDESILAGEWGRFSMSDVRNEGVKAILAGEFERLKLACMCVPSPLRKRGERYGEDNVMVRP
jgi:hypothetical protein